MDTTGRTLRFLGTPVEKHCCRVYWFLTNVVSLLQTDKDIERAQEAELRAKYPNVRGPGASALLQKRLSKGVSLSAFNCLKS